MVRDALLRRGHGQGGDGKLERRKSSEEVFSESNFGLFLYLTVPLFSLQRRYTQHHEDTKDQIYFMQTDTPVYDTNKKARIAASEVSTRSTRARTKVSGYFYKSYLMWKTRQ